MVAVAGGSACGIGVTPNLVSRHDSGSDPPPSVDWGAGDAAPAGPVGPPCASSAPFVRVAKVPGLDFVGEGISSARFSPDELVAYLGINVDGVIHIAISARRSRAEPFSVPAPLSAVNSPSAGGTMDDGFPTVTSDGLTMYLHSARTGAYKLYTAQRSFAGAEFSRPAELTSLNVFGEGDPFVTSDDGALYFHSWRTGDQPDLYRAKIGRDGFDSPRLLAELASGAVEYAPVVEPGELAIYYFSNRADRAGPGIWTATRTSMDVSFGPSIRLPMGVVGTNVLEVPNWISPDRCRLYFTALDDLLPSRLYVAERAPLPAR